MKNHVWDLTFDWELVDGRPEVTEFKITSRNSRSPITASVLRSMPIASIFEDLLKRLPKTEHLEVISSSEEAPDGLTASQIGRVRDADRGSRRGIPLEPELLQRVASLYLEALAKRTPAHKYIAEAFDVSPSTAAKRIMAARAAGLLPTPQIRRDDTPARKNDSTSRRP